MRRRHLLAALPLALAAGSALAAGGGGEGEKKADSQFVNLSPIALPVVVNGRVINYVFVQLRVNLTPSADAAKWRTKEPWFRDAIVRAGHRTPFTVATDYTRIDEARVKAALMREAVAITGPKVVTSVSVLNQTPKQRSRLPRPPGR
ncbi:hypothetical protein [Caulobacter mirabilis]|uniref:Uncharacterized protein n=1 Tax=Caulobacter mirabilis TaxID=69666 RepID=A0A2D2AXM8_9CAUL|nr:hypothetical protein [Caulobacter mirabilis]ATQ42779.1 hypothetical protein CSW64_10330 [Caulobacter mirabilis]